jgi:hypothetical protein
MRKYIFSGSSALVVFFGTFLVSAADQVDCNNMQPLQGAVDNYVETYNNITEGIESGEYPPGGNNETAEEIGDAIDNMYDLEDQYVNQCPGFSGIDWRNTRGAPPPRSLKMLTK